MIIDSLVRNILKIKILLPAGIALVLIIFTLFFGVGYLIEKNTIVLVTKNAKSYVQKMQLTRAYYVENVVGDIQKYAPNIVFHYNHNGLNGKIPLPSTTIENLSEIFGKNNGLKYRLYSEYPFFNKKNRVLTDFQKEAIKFTKKNPKRAYIKKDFIDNEPVLRVAIADFMTSQTCVNCHNNHPEKTWGNNRWSVGDNRGVLEVVTPIAEDLKQNDKTKNFILFFIISIIVTLFAYYIFLMIQREQKFDKINKRLKKQILGKEKKLDELYDEYGKNVMLSEVDLNGNIIYVSELFCKISQYSKDELIGKSHRIIRHPNMPNTLFKELWEQISIGKTWRGEMRNLKQDGDSYWVYATISPIYDRHKRKIIGYKAIRKDITLEKKLELLKKSLNYKIKKAVIASKEEEKFKINESRLSQLGEMMGMIAHHWRQPLAAISATAETLQLKLMLDDYQKEFFLEQTKSISILSQNLSFTIDDFRNFFKQNREQSVTTLENIIENSLEIISSSLESQKIAIVTNFKCYKELCTYPEELRQALLNLIKNSEDILVERDIKNPQIEINSFKSGNFAYLTIKDNAGGIARKNFEKIFDPYFTTKAKRDGTGLGLYIAKIIVEEHCQGKLKAFNSLTGAIFEIELEIKNKE